MKGKWLKGLLIGLGAVMLSTLGIFASDTLRGIDLQISNVAGLGNASICMDGAVPLRVDGSVVCIDQYEASPGEDCPNQKLTSSIHSERNIGTEECFAVSITGKQPWNYISLSQAQRVCARSGKRLPTSAEWYAYALGTDTKSCVIDEKEYKDTGTSGCVSSTGVYDVIGNLWEWVDESVVGGTFNNQKLPEDGYVSSVDANGIAITSTGSPDELYEEDYFWAKSEGVYGMIRGGFYGSGSDAGLYTTNASVQTSLATLGIGFRCVEDTF